MKDPLACAEAVAIQCVAGLGNFSMISTRAAPVSEILPKFPARYYWSVYQSEWATDVAFWDAATLQRLYPI